MERYRIHEGSSSRKYVVCIQRHEARLGEALGILCIATATLATPTCIYGLESNVITGEIDHAEGSWKNSRQLCMLI
jgi:hypothetical protein